MLHTDAFGLLLGAVALGAVHGVEPGHGWPVAASYALDQTHKWLHGLAASLLLGVGHLVSSIAMVAVFFYFKGYFELTQVNEPITLLADPVTVTVGGPVSIVAGVVLVALGVREYRHGHSHSHGGHDHGEQGHADGHGHSHDDHSHSDHSHDDHSHSDHSHDDHSHSDHSHDDHSHSDHSHDDHSHDDHSHNHDDHSDRGAGDGVWSRAKRFLPFVGGHSHDHADATEAADRGLLGIAWFAFLLGFAHEEEFEIIALCAGSTHCLELMSAYALTVIAGIVLLTLLLIAGYQQYEERVEAYTDYLPVFSAAVLVLMGTGFVLGLF